MSEMSGILIFDEMNDVLFTKFDENFEKHLLSLAFDQGFIAPESTDNLNNDILIQIFSPIITSQRIMSTQFGNSYRCIQCEDGLNIAFSEYLGYLFFVSGRNKTDYLHRLSGVCVTAVKHLCAGDLSLFKTKEHFPLLLSQILEKWVYLYNNEQSFLTDCTEQLLVNSELSTTSQRALKEAADNLTKAGHALIFVGNKVLSLFSSINSYPLTPEDLLFLNMFCQVVSISSKFSDKNIDAVDEESLTEVFTNTIFLNVGTTKPSCVPHIIYTIPLSSTIILVLISEYYHYNIAPSLHESFLSLNLLKLCLQQREMDLLKPAFENLDSSIKHITDGLKKCKIKNAQIDNMHRNLHNKWEVVKKKYSDFFKTDNNDCLVSVDSLMGVLWEAIRFLFHAACFSEEVSNKEETRALDVARKVKSRLSSFSDFLQVKAMKNFTLGSKSSLSINKYLEEFPGMVHFIYIDRTQNRMTAPTIDFTSPETLSLTKEKVWSMVEFSNSYLSRGQTSIVWKDSVFCYGRFLWFSERSGTPIAPPNGGCLPNKHEMLTTLPEPGLLCGDFYQKLIAGGFPKTSPSKILCYELYSIHLGLTTTSCVLEHARRLAATIWEVTGAPLNPLDLF